MTKRVKKDRLSKWDDGDDALNDDQDDHISERSSVLSAEGNFRGQPNAPANQEQYQDPYYNGEGPHTLRYFYNEQPMEGAAKTKTVKEAKKEEKRRLKDEIEARRGQGRLVQGPATEPTGEMNDNYFPYWYYYKAKNPDWIMRQQQYNDAEYMPPIDPTKKIQPIDPEQLPEEPKLTLAQRKARQFQYGDDDEPVMKYNHALRRYEMIGKDGKVVGVVKDKAPPDSKQFVPLKDGEDEEARLKKNGRYSRSDDRRGKLQTEYDWAAHYSEYMRNKSSMGNNPPNYRPNIRSRNRRSRKDYDPLKRIYGEDGEELDDDPNSNHSTRNRNNGRGRNYNGGNDGYSRGNRYTSRSQQGYTSNSGPNGQRWYNNGPGRSNQNYSAPHNNQDGRHQHGHSHGHSHNHNHGQDQNQSSRHHISSKDLTGNSYRVFNASGGNLNGKSQLFQSMSGYSRAPPSIYNQGSFLPPLGRDSYGGSHPTDYYGTQALTNDWKTLSYAPQMYKANAQTKFYDRYLNNVIDKRLFA